MKQLLAPEAASPEARATRLADGTAVVDALSGRGLGVARFIRDRRDPRAADTAITVVDAAQGHGLGRALLERLAERARQEGVERFSADVLEDNRRMVSMLVLRGASGQPAAGWPGVRHFELPLGA